MQWTPCFRNKGKEEEIGLDWEIVVGSPYYLKRADVNGTEFDDDEEGHFYYGREAKLVKPIRWSISYFQIISNFGDKEKGKSYGGA